MMTYVDLFFDKGGYDMLFALEERYSCASICTVPLFYLARDVAEGPPEEDCFTAAVKDITNNETAAIIFIVAAVILFAAMLGGFPLCCKQEGEKEEETGRRKNYEVEGKTGNAMN
jgi:hypothetical protein